MTTEGRPVTHELRSAARKPEVVSRLVRGGSFDEVAREIQVPDHELEVGRR
jgi:hypothetical protein